MAELVGADRLLSCIVEWGGTNLGPGRVVRDTIAPMVVGELDGTERPRTQLLARCLEAVGDVRLTRNVRGQIWSKLLVNSAFTGLSAVSGLRYGAVAEHPDGREAAYAIWAEGFAVAWAEGVTLDTVLDVEPRELVDRDDAALARMMAIAGNTKPSMLQDLEQGRLTEVDVVNGGVAQRARAHRIATPFNDRVVELVHAMERGERSPAPGGADRARPRRGAMTDSGNARTARSAALASRRTTSGWSVMRRARSIRITAATAVAVAVAAIGAQAAPAATGFERGDVLASVGDPSVIARFAADGTPKGTLDDSAGAGPLCFDASGEHLIAPGAGSTTATGRVLDSEWAFGDPRQRLVHGRRVGRRVRGRRPDQRGCRAPAGASIRRFDLTGHLLHSYDVDATGNAYSARRHERRPGARRMHDLLRPRRRRRDQALRRVHRDPEGRVQQPRLPCDGLRVRPNGQVLVTCDTYGRLFDASGVQVHDFANPTGTTSLRYAALDPDGSSFWIGEYRGVLARYDIESGESLGSWSAGDGLHGVALYSPPPPPPPPADTGTSADPAPMQSAASTVDTATPAAATLVVAPSLAVARPGARLHPQRQAHHVRALAAARHRPARDLPGRRSALPCHRRADRGGAGSPRGRRAHHQRRRAEQNDRARRQGQARRASEQEGRGPRPPAPQRPGRGASHDPRGQRPSAGRQDERSREAAPPQRQSVSAWSRISRPRSMSSAEMVSGGAMRSTLPSPANLTMLTLRPSSMQRSVTAEP